MRKKMLGCVAAGIAFFMTIPSAAFAADSNEILMRGEKNDNVVELQQILKQKGFYNSDITGFYGEETEQAVKEYQEKNGLEPDGKVGPETSLSLFGQDYTTLLASLSSDNKTDLLPGDTGDNIVLLQKRLQYLEYYDYDTTTGFYGPLTQEAVKTFQQDTNLLATGIADEKTLSELFAQDAPSYTMALGDTGSGVQKLQDHLNKLGYFNSDSTGYYGDATQAAVTAFQKANALPEDGKAGPETRKLLYSDDAKAFSGGDSSSSMQDTEGLQSENMAVNKAVGLAYDLLGKEYIYGASGPNSFDCSGFIYYILSNAGISVNKMSPAAMSALDGWQTVTNIESLEIGDIVFFKSDDSNNICHMGIYVGGGSFIHASQTQDSVAISTMTSGYYNKNFVLARRIS